MTSILTGARQRRADPAVEATAPVPRRPLEQPRRLRMTWEPVLDENGTRRLRARWHAGC
ncbi:hypothetical protein ATK30_8788 [Amycolatopsis echigonensis]|uniref:Uncharacterized protein n=1 Tax=Amycolatopsis echigonensis TaxID=2576905 RepID=A0A2N3WV97_9PSEU|nr:hypothetical protein [Amycolatopsis niigatensis]PKV97788.1 hypothetical protein ATK30_8788 [Amycolatopsis niigatensis]